jgi:hypothetical protein
MPPSAPAGASFLAQGAANGKPWVSNCRVRSKPHRGALAAADQGAPMGLGLLTAQQPRAWAFALRPGLRKTPLPGLKKRASAPHRRQDSMNITFTGINSQPAPGAPGPAPYSGKSKVHWFAPRASAPEAAMKITFTGFGRAVGPLPPLPGNAAEAAPLRRVAVPARAGGFRFRLWFRYK